MTKPLLTAVAAIGLLLVFGAQTAAQSQDPYVPTNVTNQNRAGDLPFSASVGTDVEHVDLASGNLVVRIPIASVKGRGMDFDFAFNYTARYLSVQTSVVPMVGSYYEHWNMEANGPNLQSGFVGPTDFISLGWAASKSHLSYGTIKVACATDPPSTSTYKVGYIFWDANSVKHPFAVQWAGGGQCASQNPSGPGLGGDGMWGNISDNETRLMVYRPDGTSGGVSVNSTGAIWTDSNGNQLGEGPGATDTLGRAIITQQNGTNQVFYYVIDSNGVQQTYTVNYSYSINLQTSFHAPSDFGIYPTIGEYTSTSPQIAVNSIVLPNGRSYQFQYESGTYGAITRIDLPTGAYITYTWATLVDASRTVRYVASRTLNVGGQAFTWNFSRTGSNHNYTLTMTDPLGNQSVYGINDDVVTSAAIYQGAAGGTPLRQYTIDYVKDGDPLFDGNQPGAIEPQPVAHRPIRITTTLDDGQVSKKEFDYDSFSYTFYDSHTDMFWNWADQFFGTRGNVTAIREYPYGQGAPGAVPIRQTTKTYLHDSNPTYLSYNIVDKVLSNTILDGSNNQQAQTQFEYDTTSLTGTSGAPSHDYTNYPSSFTYRGNASRVKKWRNTDDALVTTTYGYDDLGNIRSITDPLNHTTSWTYSDNWSGSACLPPGNSLALPTQMTNALNQTVHMEYFPCTGLRQSLTDFNNRTTSYAYDLFGRNTQKNLPDGGQTTITYNDTPPITVTTSSKITSSLNMVSVALKDSLGRVTQTQLTSDPDGITYADTTYDGLGRKSTESNPYRSTSETTYGTTTFNYDALGRTSQVIPPDGSSTANNVTTTYYGTMTTVIDQAGKQRRSYTDALGRLVQVDEPGAVGVGTPGSASETVSGTLQSQYIPGTNAAAGTGNVAISGSEQSVIGQNDRLIYDTGNVSITVNGFVASVSYGRTSTAGSVANDLASAFNGNGSSPVTASVTSSTVYLTSKVTGSASNYTLSATSNTNDPGDFGGPSFYATPSGSTLTGGRDQTSGTTVYDAGTVSMTVGGFTASVSYGQTGNSTSALVASALASVFNGNNTSPVTAVVSGSSLTLTSKLTGAATNYSVSSTSSTSQGAYFSSPSFTATSTALSGGTDPNLFGNPNSTYYTYDLLDNLTCVEQHGNVSGTGCAANPSNDATSPWRVRRFTYNSLSQLLTAKNPESGTIAYTYNDDGFVTSKQDARGITISYTPDVLHRVTGKTYSNGDPAVSYLYDQSSYNGLTIANGIGRRTGMSDASGATAWSYDPMGRALTERRTISGITKSIGYTYNLDGSPATLTYPSNRTITYSYSGAGRALSAVDTANGINYATSALYAPQGAVTSVKYGVTGSFTGIVTSNSYNKRLQPIILSAASPSHTVFSLGYDFQLGTNDNGNVYGIANNRDGFRPLVGSATYSYDSLNRIQSASTTGTDCTVVNGFSKNWGESFSIDPWGNLLSITPSKCSAENLQVSVTLANGGSKNQITTSGYQYDAAGNMTLDGQGHAPVYDAEGRIKTVAGVNYTYDGNGNRVKKDSGKMYWTGTGADPLDESDLSGTFNEEFIFFNGKRLARLDLPSAAVHYYFSDHLGSASVITNATGSAIEQESDYYPYGGERIIAAGLNNYKFTGKERDAESNLDYFGVRHYSSALGRFTEPDPNTFTIHFLTNPQKWNRYPYVLNNPPALTDPNGFEERSFLYKLASIFYVKGSFGPALELGAQAHFGKAKSPYKIGVSIGGDLKATGKLTIEGLTISATKEAGIKGVIGKHYVGPQVSQENVTVRDGKALTEHEVTKPQGSLFFGTEKAEATASKGEVGIGHELQLGVIVIGFEGGVNTDKLSELAKEAIDKFKKAFDNPAGRYVNENYDSMGYQDPSILIVPMNGSEKKR